MILPVIMKKVIEILKTYNVIVRIIGHCSMIGAETGKVLNYAVRSKSCRVCKKAENSNSTPVAHDCRRNFDGSAKSMESDMVVSMVKDLNEKGIKTATIVADDDSTTFCRLRAESAKISHLLFMLYKENTNP